MQRNWSHDNFLEHVFEDVVRLESYFVLITLSRTTLMPWKNWKLSSDILTFATFSSCVLGILAIVLSYFLLLVMFGHMSNFNRCNGMSKLAYVSMPVRKSLEYCPSNCKTTRRTSTHPHFTGWEHSFGHLPRRIKSNLSFVDNQTTQSAVVVLSVPWAESGMHWALTACETATALENVLHIRSFIINISHWDSKVK